jgi:serine/threonine protein kinase
MPRLEESNMGSPGCPSPEQLRAFHLGDLPEASLNAIAEHLDLCPRCETLARQLDTQVDGVLKAIRAAAAEEAPSRAPAAPERAPRHQASTPRYPFLQPPTQDGDLGRLANYRVLRLLGAGGMGYVFQAEDQILRRGVALKVMKPNLTPDADGWERFTREARVMASLRHRHLATVYQAGEENGVVYLAMELLEGETLESRLERLGRLPAPEVLRLGQEIAAGLAVVHAQGLIHRDIKPANIWLETNDNVKILDFGLARCIKDKARLTQTGLVMGTPTYMSPEQAAGRALDARSDLFSLGVVLYRACSGREPFDGHNTMAVLAALAVATPRPLHEVTREAPQDLSDFVSRLLRRDPTERPASAEEVVGELKALASEVPWPQLSAVVRQQPPVVPADIPEATPRRSTSRKKRRQKQSFRGWPWLVGGVGALLLGVIVVLACWPPRGNVPPEPPQNGPDHADSVAGPIEPMNPVDANADVVYLTALTPAEQVQWFSSQPGPPGRPAPPGAEGPKRITVGGKASPHGIFMHGPPPHLGGGPSSITYRLNGTFRTFEADVSINDGPPYSETAITFSVYDGSGKRLWRSKPVTSQKDTQHVSVPIENVDTLKLEMRCADEKVRGSHAVWIEPRLKR